MCPIAAKCRVNDLRAHFKNTYETARVVRGMKLKKAIKYMEDVLEHKQCVPIKRFN
jgi:large subunit ribosomal protein L17e